MNDQVTTAAAPSLEIHRAGNGPTFTRLSQAQVADLVKLRLPQFPIIQLSTSMDLTARQPFDGNSGRMDVYKPGRWDTSQNLIYMDAIVQGSLVGEWDGSVVYAQFTPTTAGAHLIAVHFSGVQATMRLNGPWGVTTAATETVNDPGVVLASWEAAAGKTIFFTVDCVVPNNLPGLGYIDSIQAFN